MASCSATIDFNEIATAHSALYNVRGNPQRGLRVNDTKLTSISLTAASPVEWDPQSMTKRKRTENTRTSSPISTDNNMKEEAEVTITSGLCKGLNTKVQVPYPGDHSGSHVLDIDPCNKEVQVKVYVTRVTPTSQPRGRSVGVETGIVKLEYHGEFKCRVYPGGFILKDADTRDGEESHGQIKTQTVISDLKHSNPHAVRHFEQDERGKFYFIMRGRCDLKLDAQMQHNWQ